MHSRGGFHPPEKCCLCLFNVTAIYIETICSAIFRLLVRFFGNILFVCSFFRQSFVSPTPRTTKKTEKKSVSQTIEKIMTKNSVRKSSKSELSSRFLSRSVWNTRIALLGTQEMSCLEHRSQKTSIARNHGIMGLKISSWKNDKF